MANDALFRGTGTGLKLRFDQRNKMGWRLGKPERGRECQLQRNKADIDADKVGRLSYVVARQFADVGGIKRDNFWSCTKYFVKLVCADVDGIDASRAATQQDLREPSS